MTLTAIDLFCGAGGITAGLQEGGFEVLAGIDSWAPAAQSYASNFAHPILCKDISAINPAQQFWDDLGLAPRAIDLVAGGPPCQGFSIQRIGVDEDNRNDLVLEFGRFVAELRPRMFLMENVLGLIGKRGRRTATRFEAMLLNEGYAVRSVRVNAADYGVPQTRKRLFHYGWREETVPPFSFPRPTVSPKEYRTVKDAIGDLLPPPPDYKAPAADPLHRRMRLSARNLERLRLIPPGGGFEHLPVHMRVDCHKDGPDRIGHRYVYGRLAFNKPAGTITARFDSFTRGKFAHPADDRNITLREGARLQTFGDGHIFRGTQEEITALIGNAVPPLLAKIISRAMADHLRGGRHMTELGPKSSRNREPDLFSSVMGT